MSTTFACRPQRGIFWPLCPQMLPIPMAHFIPDSDIFHYFYSLKLIYVFTYALSLSQWAWLQEHTPAPFPVFLTLRILSSTHQTLMKYLLCESWLFLILYFHRQNANIKTKVTNEQKWKPADSQEDFIILIKFQLVSCLVSLRQWFSNMRLQTGSADLTWEFVRKANSKPTSTHWPRSSRESDAGICLVKRIPGDSGAH